MLKMCVECVPYLELCVSDSNSVILVDYTYSRLYVRPLNCEHTTRRTQEKTNEFKSKYSCDVTPTWLDKNRHDRQSNETNSKDRKKE